MFGGYIFVFMGGEDRIYGWEDRECLDIGGLMRKGVGDTPPSTRLALSLSTHVTAPVVETPT